jgi:hypothetical protein
LERVAQQQHEREYHYGNHQRPQDLAHQIYVQRLQALPIVRTFALIRNPKCGQNAGNETTRTLFYPTLHRTLPRASPLPRRSTSDPGVEVLRRGNGEVTGRHRRRERTNGDAAQPITPKTAKNPTLARKYCNCNKLPDQPRVYLRAMPAGYRHNTLYAGRT